VEILHEPHAAPLGKGSKAVTSTLPTTPDPETLMTAPAIEEHRLVAWSATSPVGLGRCQSLARLRAESKAERKRLETIKALAEAAAIGESLSGLLVAGVGLGLGADIFDRSHRVDLTHLGIWSRGYQTTDRKQAGAHHNACLREVQQQLRLARDARMAYCLGDSWKGAG
jgi:hypothetical protein